MPQGSNAGQALGKKEKMIQEIIKQWDKNKTNLETYFKGKHPDSYEEIVKKLFELCINDSDSDNEYDVSEITVIDHGDYQGTQIFIIPRKTYQPSTSDYLWFDNSYGSCSGCDTLQRIRSYSDEPPTEEQTKDYMILALHLVQRMKPLTGKEEY